MRPPPRRTRRRGTAWGPRRELQLRSRWVSRSNQAVASWLMRRGRKRGEMLYCHLRHGKKSATKARPPARTPNCAPVTSCLDDSVHSRRVRRRPRTAEPYNDDKQQAAVPMAAQRRRLRAYLERQFAHGDHRTATPELPTTQHKCLSWHELTEIADSLFFLPP